MTVLQHDAAATNHRENRIMTVTTIANAHNLTARTTRASAALLPVAITSHLVLDNDTGRVVGMQRSMTLQGRSFSSAITPVLA